MSYRIGYIVICKRLAGIPNVAQLVRLRVPTKVIRVHNKVFLHSGPLTQPWFDDQRRTAFGFKQEAHHRWTRDCSRVNWEEFVHFQVSDNRTIFGGQASV